METLAAMESLFKVLTHEKIKNKNRFTGICSICGFLFERTVKGS